MRGIKTATPPTSGNSPVKQPQQESPETAEEQHPDEQTDGRERMALIGPWVVFLTAVFIWSFY